jgi:dihydroorotate dehydrogenase electron transfer subunit
MDLSGQVDGTRSAARMMQARVLRQEELCLGHGRVVLALPRIDGAQPGQFLHVGPVQDAGVLPARPFLRRAFSIGGLRSGDGGCEADIIYRVQGEGTRWLAGLRAGDELSVLGPLGRGFKPVPGKSTAWLVAGGVGLPPILWLAEHLGRSDRSVVAFCGARSADLIPLTVRDPRAISAGVVATVDASEEFGRLGTPLLLSTDDGSVGFRGSVLGALDAYRVAWGGRDDDVVVYACGPEVMLAAVAEWCGVRGLTCFVCMEREMACGTGTCQSCVVRVRDEEDEEGWRYALCCTEGPVFDARDVLWS